MSRFLNISVLPRWCYDHTGFACFIGSLPDCTASGCLGSALTYYAYECLTDKIKF